MNNSFNCFTCVYRLICLNNYRLCDGYDNEEDFLKATDHILEILKGLQETSKEEDKKHNEED